MRKIMIVGAHGVIGGAVARAAAEQGRDIVTVARRGPVSHNGGVLGEHITVDLLDRDSTVTALSTRADIDSVVFAAYIEKPTMAETIAPNVTMLANLLDGLAAHPVRRVVLIGGGKSYGEHLGGYKTPAKESDPRFLGPIFYNDQEDLLVEHAERHGYSWTVLRPDAVIGPSLGSPMNMLTGVAVYATICKHLGVPLRFPGTNGAWTALHQATDARVVADATLWALEASSAENEIFNVTNGDHFRWQHLWAEIAADFGMDTAPPQPMSLQEQMADKAAVWNRIVTQHGLLPLSLDRAVSWPFVDDWFGNDGDMVQSTIKIRQAGFGGCLDTHQSFIENFATLRALNFIP
ncbi:MULTISPECIES: SDR family oxidoreductase [Mycolicibacterium]|nr:MULTISPECIES: SDR family oxidoreductase [Mycolicibacterium]